MIEVNATLATVVALIVGLAGPYLAYRSHQQDRLLKGIEHNVNSRLTEALDELKKLRELIITSQTTGRAVPKDKNK